MGATTNLSGTTNTVTAQLGGSFEESEGIYIFGNPQLEITAGDGGDGPANTKLSGGLQVTLTDNAEAGVVGVPIKFDVTDKSPSGGIILSAATGTIVDASNEEISSPPGSTMYVRTGASGVASITFQLGTIPGEQTITAGALGIARLTETIKVTATPTPATRQLFADDIDRHGTTNIYTLVARVENGGKPDADETVTFTTTKGFLTGDTNTAKTVTAMTNAAGKARVTHNIGNSSGSVEVVASISVGETVITQLSEVTFNVRGGGRSDPPPPPPPSDTITISPLNTTGEPGEEVTIRVTSSPSGALVTLGSNDFGATRFSPQSDVTPFTSTLLLPVEEGTHSFFATGGVLTAGRASVTVEAELGELSITAIGTPERRIANL